MPVETHHISLSTKGDGDIRDLTEQVASQLSETKLKDGIVTVFVPGSTASITTIEFEPGLKKDIPEVLNRLIPSGIRYHHDDTWGDGNGYAHVRAAFIGPGITVPFTDGRLDLGTWQQIVLLEFDNRSRRREIIMQFVGE
ncbi:secondary thiamine-phosphate synthase enzyme YjbQ [bacterium]|nr:secondary thiamine-phosphate synthase enzyme YjbQ [bacterium]